MAMPPGANQRRYVGRHRESALPGETTREIPPRSPLPKRLSPWPQIGDVPTVRLSAEAIAAVVAR